MGTCPMTQRVFTAILLASLAFSKLSAFGGTLDPPGPPGDPAADMKSLNQIEPRRVIESLPYAITNPGAYYVVGNLVATNTNQNGITIQASDVQLDLNGFSLMGVTNGNWAEYSTNATLTAILIPEIQDNIVIRNGALRYWGEHGIKSILGKNCRITDVIVSNCGSTNDGTKAGITLGPDWVVSDCVLLKNGGDGISMQGVARRCIAKDNGRHGIYVMGGRVEDCQAKANAQDGIHAEGSTVIRNCIADNNPGNGIFVTDDCYVRNNKCADNGHWSGTGAGIQAGSQNRIEDNFCKGNQYGIQVKTGHTRSIIIRNVAASSVQADYDLNVGTHYGQILTNGVLGTEFNYPNPWANFSL